MTTTILEFKAKPTTHAVYATALCDLDGWHMAYDTALKVPTLDRKHVVQCGGRLNSYINSDLCGALIARMLKTKYGRKLDYIDMENPPKGVTVKDTGFLKTVTIEIEG